jgi:hypothetical protein
MGGGDSRNYFAATLRPQMEYFVEAALCELDDFRAEVLL